MSNFNGCCQDPRTGQLCGDWLSLSRLIISLLSEKAVTELLTHCLWRSVQYPQSYNHGPLTINMSSRRNVPSVLHATCIVIHLIGPNLQPLYAVLIIHTLFLFTTLTQEPCFLEILVCLSQNLSKISISIVMDLWLAEAGSNILLQYWGSHMVKEHADLCENVPSIYSGFSDNSEAFASELLENFKRHVSPGLHT